MGNIPVRQLGAVRFLTVCEKENQATVSGRGGTRCQVWSGLAPNGAPAYIMAGAGPGLSFRTVNSWRLSEEDSRRTLQQVIYQRHGKSWTSTEWDLNSQHGCCGFINALLKSGFVGFVYIVWFLHVSVGLRSTTLFMLGEQLFTLITYLEIKKHKQKLKGLSNHSKGINAFIVTYN